MEERKITPDALWRMMADSEKSLREAGYPGIGKYFTSWDYLHSRIIYGIERDIPRAYIVALQQYDAAMEWLEETQSQ